MDDKGKMITELTPEQEALLPEYRDKWMKIGLCTDRIDFEEAKKAVALMYQCADLEVPKIIRYARSPIEAADIVYELSEGKISRESSVYSCVFGGQDAFWLSFFDYFENVLGFTEAEKVKGLIQVAYTCGWVNCYDTAAIIQDRPITIKLDEENRLHCENGPAVEYSDGFKVYSWHGTRVPGEWIEDGISAIEAFKVENTEQRRCAFEIIGYSNVLKELKTTVIDEDGDPEIGKLVRVADDVELIGGEQFLVVRCGTGREFALPVPPDVTTALEGNAWTYGLDPQELLGLEIRT